jgi:hypothetical protein
MPHDVDSKVTFRSIPDRRQQPDRRAQWRGGRRGSDFASSMRELAARVIGHYAEQPGVKLTLDDAARLFAVDLATCGGVLEMLVRRGVLLRTVTGQFLMVAGASGQLRVTIPGLGPRANAERAS